MPVSPFLTMAGEKKEKTPIAKSPLWESLGEEFTGSWSGVPSYWKLRKKHLKELAEKHGMWLVKEHGIYYLAWKGKSGKPDLYTSKDLWDVMHKMKDVGKLKRVI